MVAGRRGPRPAQPPLESLPQGLGRRYRRVADPQRAAAAPPPRPPYTRPGVRHQPAGPRRAARRRPRRARPGPAVLPAGRGPVQAVQRQRDSAPAPALRADSQRRGRYRHADADGQERPYIGAPTRQVRPRVRRGPCPVAVADVAAHMAASRRGHRAGRPSSLPRSAGSVTAPRPRTLRRWCSTELRSARAVTRTPSRFTGPTETARSRRRSSVSSLVAFIAPPVRW